MSPEPPSRPNPDGRSSGSASASGSAPERPATGDAVTSARRRHGGLSLLGRLAIVALVLAVGGGLAWVVARASQAKPGPSATVIPAMQVQPADVQPGSKAPPAVKVVDVKPAADPRPQAGTSSTDPLTQWAQRVAAATGIPQRALWAYGDAELVMRVTSPSCHLSWATLAGIGRVESDHGRFGGAVVLPNGEESKPIIGVPLNGTGNVAEVADSDHGALDGDTSYDRAVGPMQFLPSTWRRYASDGNGDHKGDPENIDDAALAAARYLCVGGRNMATPEGWWSGLMSYNDSAVYGQKVFGLADTYARQAAAALGR